MRLTEGELPLLSCRMRKLNTLISVRVKRGDWDHLSCVSVSACVWWGVEVGETPPNVCEEWSGNFKMSLLVTRIQKIWVWALPHLCSTVGKELLQIAWFQLAWKDCYTCSLSLVFFFCFFLNDEIGFSGVPVRGRGWMGGTSWKCPCPAQLL